MQCPNAKKLIKFVSLGAYPEGSQQVITALTIAERLANTMKVLLNPLVADVLKEISNDKTLTLFNSIAVSNGINISL